LLEAATRPTKLPNGVDPSDLGEMSDAEFRKFVRDYRRTTQAAQKGKR
jgi:hypothetical protein